MTVSGSGLGRARVLDCDEVCAQEERNRQLASALEIEAPVISPLVNHDPQYSSFLLELEAPVISPLVNHDPQYSSFLLEQARCV